MKIVCVVLQMCDSREYCTVWHWRCALLVNIGQDFPEKEG